MVAIIVLLGVEHSVVPFYCNLYLFPFWSAGEIILLFNFEALWIFFICWSGKGLLAIDGESTLLMCLFLIPSQKILV